MTRFAVDLLLGRLRQDSFSIGDGPNYRFDDPANALFLQQTTRMNVQLMYSRFYVDDSPINTEQVYDTLAILYCYWSN